MDTIKPLLFFDSCALVKLFVDEDEPATTIVRRLWDARKEIYSSVISIGEVLSVFARKKREECLSPVAYIDACSKFISSLRKSPIEEIKQAIKTFRGESPLVTTPIIKLLPSPEYVNPVTLSNMVKKYDIEFGDAWHRMALLSGLGMFDKKFHLLFVSADGNFCDAVKKEGYEVLNLKKGKSQDLKDIIQNSIKRG